MSLPNAWPTPGAVGWNTALEGNVEYAARVAEQALSIVGGTPGVVQIDSFPGATDAAKMQAALSWAAAQTNVPWLQLPARTFNTGSTSFAMFTGMKIVGAGYIPGPKNLEISGGKPVVGKWQTSCGTGAASLLTANTAVSGIALVGIAFHGTSGSQALRSISNVYPAWFDALTFYGFKNAIGNPAEKFLCTQAVFSGHWTLLGFSDTQVNAGGSDCLFNWYVNCNSPSSVSGAGRPMLIWDSMGKTDFHYCYLTAENDWIGMQLKGALDRKTTFFGGTFEGRGATNLATRAVIDVQGAHVVMYSPHIGYVSSSGSTGGAITQSGGVLDLYSPTYLRGDATSAAFPLLYQTGGVASVTRPVSSKGEQIRLRWSDTTTATLPLPTNGYTA